MIFKNKRGSASVFITMIAVALIGMITVFVQVSKARAVSSAVNSLGNLWSESITSEYDINLRERYGLFGFRYTADEVNHKIGKMAEYSFGAKRYIRSVSLDSDMCEYSLALPDVFKKQILKEGQVKKVSEKEKTENTGDSRTIANKAILNALPSWENDVSKISFNLGETLKNLKSLDQVIKDGGSRYFINNYINCHFKDNLNGKQLDDTYFKNEIEYLICGKTDDEKNLDAVRNRIIAVREVLNFNYLTSDPEKNAALTAASEFLTPGPQAVLTKQALKASWALAESVNDYRLLKAGKTVDFLKSDASWAIDLESVLSNTEQGYIDTGFEGGNNYSDYLNFLTWLMSEELLIMRIMDLVQINMEFVYDGDFLLKDCSGGLKLNMKVNGKGYEFTSDYHG